MARAVVLITAFLLGAAIISVIFSSRYSFGQKEFNAQATVNHNLTVNEYNAMKRAILATKPPASNPSALADFYGGYLRLAFHDAATWIEATQEFGPSGCLNLNDPGNGGLAPRINSLEAIYQNYQTKVSRADFWVIAAFAVVEDAGGPSMPFRWGRDDCVPPTNKPLGLLPNPETDWAGVFDVFFTRMGLTVQDTVALLGAHTIGRCKPQNSGYRGAWDGSPTQFDNQFFTDLVNGGWNRMLNPANGTHQWNTFPAPTPPFEPFVMLDVDMALRYTDPGVADCQNTTAQAVCNPNTAALVYVNRYALDAFQWHDDFQTAFLKLTSFGAILNDLSTDSAFTNSISLLLLLLCIISTLWAQ